MSDFSSRLRAQLNTTLQNNAQPPPNVYDPIVFESGNGQKSEQKRKKHENISKLGGPLSPPSPLSQHYRKQSVKIVSGEESLESSYEDMEGDNIPGRYMEEERPLPPLRGSSAQPPDLGPSRPKVCVNASNKIRILENPYSVL